MQTTPELIDGILEVCQDEDFLADIEYILMECDPEFDEHDYISHCFFNKIIFQPDKAVVDLRFAVGRRYNPGFWYFIIPFDFDYNGEML